MQVIRSSILSRLLENERRVWLQPPPIEHPAAAICVLLDGEYYVERMDAPVVIDELMRSVEVCPFATAYVSHVDGPTRWREAVCNERFARFVGQELVPWCRSRFEQAVDSLPVILGGLSLTGLAAAHAVLTNPGAFSGVLCQSASFWWADQWLIKQCPSHVAARFRISCGSLETAEYVDHGPNLIQRTSQLSSNRAMRDALLANGCDVDYEEFVGDHDLASWKTDLPNSLTAVFGKRSKQAP